MDDLNEKLDGAIERSSKAPAPGLYKHPTDPYNYLVTPEGDIYTWSEKESSAAAMGAAPMEIVKVKPSGSARATILGQIADGTLQKELPQVKETPSDLEPVITGTSIMEPSEAEKRLGETDEQEVKGESPSDAYDKPEEESPSADFKPDAQPLLDTDKKNRFDDMPSMDPAKLADEDLNDAMSESALDAALNKAISNAGYDEEEEEEEEEEAAEDEMSDK
jgi:hypothetical protein